MPQSPLPVELATVPAPVRCSSQVVGWPVAGTTLMFTVVPSGTLLAPTVSVTGASMADGKVTSGTTIDAVKFDWHRGFPRLTESAATG